VRAHDEQQPWAAESVSSVVERADLWLGSSALHELVSRLGGPRGAAPRELATWSAATLDTRGGRERHDATVIRWPQGWVDALLVGGERLGLMRTAPAQRAAYDATMILGGTTLGNRLRTSLAAEFLQVGVAVGRLIVLTADRPLTGRERTEAATNESTEAQNALRSASEALGPFEALTDEVIVDGGREQSFVTRGGVVLTVLVADPADASRRAGTVEAVRFATRRIAAADRSTLLMLTSAIYAPFQFFRVGGIPLAEGTRYVELVGTPTDATADPRWLAQRLAQETHAAIDAAADAVEASSASGRAAALPDVSPAEDPL
jgi:hypothetical protein